MELILLVCVALFFMVIGVPIGISLLLGMISSALVFQTTTLSFITTSMYSGLCSFPLLAVPCFIIAGSIMEKGGLSRRLVDVANKLVGHTSGGLGNVAILACFFFGAISGSAPATVAAIGTIIIPHMVKAGYDEDYSAGLVAVAGGLGVIVPPSIPFIIYSVSTKTSVSDLFIAGFLPAIVIAVLLIIISKIMSKIKGYDPPSEKATIKEIGKSLWEAKWAIIMPIIILGGIYGGIFTPTEAAIVAVFYSLIIGLFVYKEITIKDTFTILNKNTSFLGGFMLTFAPAAALGGLLTMFGVPDMMRNFLLSVSTNIWVILLIINVFLLFVGMLLDTTSAIVIFAPILWAVLKPFGINPIHLGIMMTVNLAIGFVTPPVAINLFVASSLTGVPIEKIVRKAFPFMIGLFVALILITIFPGISLALVNILTK